MHFALPSPLQSASWHIVGPNNFSQFYIATVSGTSATHSFMAAALDALDLLFNADISSEYLFLPVLAGTCHFAKTQTLDN